MQRVWTVGLLLTACLPACRGGTEAEPPAKAAPSRAADFAIPSSRERFEIKNAIVREKLNRALLPAMRSHGIDMWIVLDRENNPDPLHGELGGGFSGVRAAFIFFDNGGSTPEKIYFGSHEQPANSVITQVYDEKKYYGYAREGVTPLLREAVHKRRPKKIGVNTSPTLPEADGLTVGLRDFLVRTIGPEYSKRTVPAELVVRDFRTNRTALETKLYIQLLDWTSRWESEALTDAHVKAGMTTAADIVWWLEDRASQLGLAGSGTVRVVRKGELLPVHAPDMPIEPGDIVSIDGGLQYLGFVTDIKRTAYVLERGETEPPQSIQKAWRDTHKVADLYASRMVPGGIGHRVWSELMAEVQKRGYEMDHRTDPRSDPVYSLGYTGGGVAARARAVVGIYGHSVGNNSHDIGARIAEDLPFAYGERVRFPLVQGEWVSVEFHVGSPIPEWGGKRWDARFEENGRVGPNGVEWLIPRQEKLLLIKSEGEAPNTQD